MQKYIWKSFENETYDTRDITGEENIVLLSREQIKEIIECYFNGTVLITNVDIYGYESTNVLLLEDYSFMKDDDTPVFDTDEMIINWGMCLNNALYGYNMSNAKYMLIDSAYEK